MKSFRFNVFKHIKEYAQKNNIQLDIINGVEDHVHCLIRLKTTQSITEIVQKLKGESSHWINENIVLDQEFRWQSGFGVFSINAQEVLKIRRYIYNQEEHHNNESYISEIKRLSKYNSQD